ncbi:hypothetical protein ACVWW1_003162 [Bradyrhizobium sp. JR3.5]
MTDNRAELIRRAEIMASEHRPPGFITASQLRALFSEADFLGDPDAGVSFVNELYEKGIIVTKDWKPHQRL